MFTLNRGQQFVADSAINWYTNSPEQVFQFSGNAGTGKSVVLNYIVDKLGIPRNRIAPMSYIGAAAIVMRLKGLTNAKTIHSWLLAPVKKKKYDEYGRKIMNDYFDIPELGLSFERKPLFDIDLILIDEAGCVPNYLKSVIESYGIKIIACGDLDQLPPVKDKPAYLYDGNVYMLDQLMRQSENSAIVYLAQRAKLGLPIHEGYYGDVMVISDDEVNDRMILNSDILICGKNETRESLTRKVRNDILKFTSNVPLYGEKLVCRKNNWSIETDGISLANGLIGSVSNYPDVSSFNKDILTIDFKPDLLNKSFRNIPIDFKYLSAHFKDKINLKYSTRDKYTHMEKMEYAYAITTHISQGSQYNRGMYFEEFLNKNINPHLNYTGITRFSNQLIYVKRKRKLY